MTTQNQKSTTFNDVLRDLVSGGGIRRKKWDKNLVLFYHFKNNEFIEFNMYIDHKNITKNIPLAMEDLLADDWEVLGGRFAVEDLADISELFKDKDIIK
jgi:hypothetical protein